MVDSSIDAYTQKLDRVTRCLEYHLDEQSPPYTYEQLYAMAVAGHMSPTTRKMLNGDVSSLKQASICVLFDQHFLYQRKISALRRENLLALERETARVESREFGDLFLENTGVDLDE